MQYQTIDTHTHTQPLFARSFIFNELNISLKSYLYFAVQTRMKIDVIIPVVWECVCVWEWVALLDCCCCCCCCYIHKTSYAPLYFLLNIHLTIRLHWISYKRETKMRSWKKSSNQNDGKMEYIYDISMQKEEKNSGGMKKKKEKKKKMKITTRK